MEAVARCYIPDLDSGVSIARHQDIGMQFHTRRKRLVASQGMLQLSRLYIPYPDWSIQRAAYNMDAIKLKNKENILILTEWILGIYDENVGRPIVVP